jgi:hypothetical protein
VTASNSVIKRFCPFEDPSAGEDTALCKRDCGMGSCSRATQGLADSHGRVIPGQGKLLVDDIDAPTTETDKEKVRAWFTKPLAEIVDDAAARFDARPLHRASIEARAELTPISKARTPEVLWFGEFKDHDDMVAKLRPLGFNARNEQYERDLAAFEARATTWTGANRVFDPSMIKTITQEEIDAVGVDQILMHSTESGGQEVTLTRLKNGHYVMDVKLASEPAPVDVLIPLEKPRPNGAQAKCPKCGSISGDDWRQCEGRCPVAVSPHFDVGLARIYARLPVGEPMEEALACSEPCPMHICAEMTREGMCGLKEKS